jgi:hypothetical protein
VAVTRQTLEMLKNTTGVDLETLVRRYTGSPDGAGAAGNGELATH